jgi:hypothetical protein
MQMRTTVTIDDDVLAAAKVIAAREDKTLGEVLSSLAREALRPSQRAGRSRNGVPLLAVRPDAAPVTSELVNRLRDELP